LDLNGYSIDANNTGGTGIYGASLTNITIINGSIKDFYTGIVVYYGTNITMKNLKLNSSYDTGSTLTGIIVSSSNNITIDNVTAITNYGNGISVITSNNFIITNSQVYATNNGFTISGNYGTLKNNNATGIGGFTGFNLFLSYSLIENNKIYSDWIYKARQEGSYSNFTNNQFGTTYDQFNFAILGQENYGCKNSVMPYLTYANNYVTSGDCANMTIWDNMPHTTKYNHTIWSNYTYINGTTVDTATCKAVLNGTTYSMPQNESLYQFNQHLYDVFNYSGSVYCENWGIAQKVEIPYWVMPLYCTRNFTITSNITDECYNTTTMRFNETYYDFEECDDRNLTYSIIYYIPLNYSLVSYQQTNLCHNSTSTTNIYIYNDTFGCGYNITNYTYTLLPSGQECHGNRAVVGGMTRLWLFAIFSTSLAMLLIVFIYDVFLTEEIRGYKDGLRVSFRFIGIIILLIILFYLLAEFLTRLFG